MKFNVLRLSAPASPMKGVTLSKVWRLSWVGLSFDAAMQMVAAQPYFKQDSYKVVTVADTNKYL